MDRPMLSCRICDNEENNQKHRFREMMFGTRDEFDYIECSRCGTIQLSNIPDLAKYYPENYYSFDSADIGFSQKWISRLIARQAAKHFLTGGNLLGKVLSQKKKWTRENFPTFLVDQKLSLSSRSRILDVGCGSGRLLNVLNYYGFKNLTGAEFFIDHDLKYDNGVEIFKRDLSGFEGTYDLIMFHHSLEHFADPGTALKNAYSLLQKDKFCIVRIPVAAKAWQMYGANWVQLDAPRHINLFTEHGFERLARENGFKVEATVYDSTSFQFWGSELYLRDIPLAASFENNRTFLGDLFGEEQLNQWANEADILNDNREGDQACFYLRRV